MMKIPLQLRNIYAEERPRFTLLEERVKEFIVGHKDPRWHYESRVKSLESFALKVETGRCANPARMEDFLGGTLVVRNLQEVGKAEQFVCSEFKLSERRPREEAVTAKSSDSFVFDDLRVYVEWRDGAARPSGLEGLPFEIQIKTFLQHAWAIATHDLTYKAQEKSWPKERIAFQIKAMLEHAETSILEAEDLASSASLKKVDALTRRVSEVAVLVNRLWPKADLPEDTKRLAENIEKLIWALRVDTTELETIVVEEGAEGRGTNSLILSPYGVIVQSLLNRRPDRLVDYLRRRSGSTKVYLCRELDKSGLPPGTSLPNAVIG